MALPEVGLTAVIENMPQFNKSARLIIVSYDEINRGSDKVTKKSGVLGDALGGLGKTMIGLGTVAATAAVTGIGAVTAAMTALGVSSVQTARDFESQMAILSTAVDPAVASMQDLSAAALAVGADTSLVGVSASEAADTMTGLFKAGLDVNDVFGDMQGFIAGTTELSGALRASVDLAAASELDLAAAGDLVAIAMNTFGLEAEDATRISDNFVQAADASVAEVGDLAEAMKNVGPTAAAFGFTLEDTNNALAILSTRGISGAEAGTALKSMLTNLQRPTDQVRDTLDMLGVSLFDSEGNMKDLRQIVFELSDALAEDATVTVAVGGATEKMAKQAGKAEAAIPKLTTKISEQETQLGILQRELAGTVEKYGEGSTQADKKRLAIQKLSNRLDENRAKLVGAQGTIGEYQAALGTAGTEARKLTEEQRNQAIQTVAGTFGMKALQTLVAEGAEGWDAMADATAGASSAQEVAQARTDTFEGALEALGGVVETLKIKIGNTLLPILTDMARRFAEFIDDKGPLLESIFQRVADTIETLFGVLVGDIAPEDVFPPALIALGEWLINTLPGAIQTASDFFMNTLLPALSAASGFLSENVPKAIETVRSFVVEKLIPGFQQLVDFFAPTIQRLVAGFQEFLAELAPLGGEAQRLLPILGTLAKLIGGALLIALKVLGEVVAFLLPHVGKLFTSIVSTVIDVLDGLVTFVDGAVQMIVGLFTGDMDKARKGAAKVLKGLEKIVLGFLKGILKLFTVILGVISDLIGDFLSDAWDSIKDWIRGVGRDVANFLDNLKRSIDRALDDVLSFFERTWDSIVSAVDAATSALERIVSGALDSIQSTVESVLSDIKGIFSDAWDSIKQTVSSALSEIGNLISTKWNQFRDSISSQLDQIKNIVSAKFQEIRDLVKTKLESLAQIPNEIASTLQSIGVNLIKKILDGIRSVTDFVAQVKAQLTFWFAQLRSSILTSFQAAVDIGKDLVNRIISGIRTWTEAGKGFAAWVADWLKGKFNDILTGASTLWSKIEDIGENIVSSIKQGIIDAWGDFIDWLGDRIGSIPDLLPFSPIPSAVHLGALYAQSMAAGFASQQQAMANVMAGTISGLALPAIQASVAGPAATVAGPPAGATSQTTVNNSFNLGGNTFGGAMGEAEFEARVLRVIRRNL